MRKHTEISVMNTLDKFGYRELNELQKLLFAYMNNGSWNNGKWYADLPSTWEDNGVYPEFNANSGLVFFPCVRLNLGFWQCVADCPLHTAGVS